MRLPFIAGSLDREMQHLARRVAVMGGLAERMAGEAVTALLSADPVLAAKVIGDDAMLDRSEREIDETGVLLIARRQPPPRALGEIVGAIRIAADLERIGDLAKNIAKRAGAVARGSHPPELSRGIEALADAVLNQLKDVLDAYGARAEAKLAILRDRDREIDLNFTSLVGNVLTHMAASPEHIPASTHLLFCLKNIERIGDHAAAIAETVRRTTAQTDPPAETSPPLAREAAK